jgi:putative ABC transport system permease protein
MNIQLTLAARYLLGRKLRTFLTTLAVVFGVMIIFGLNGLLPAFGQALQFNFLASTGQVDLSVTGVTDGAFDANAVDTLRGVAGVAYATGSLQQAVGLPGGSSVNAITVIGLDPATAQTVRTYTLKSGRFLQPADTNAIIIGDNLSQEAALNIGDTLTLPGAGGATDFEIVGIVAAHPGLATEEVYMPIAAAQMFLNQAGRINTIEALFEPNVDREQINTAVQSALGDRFKLGVLDSNSAYAASLQIGQIGLNLFGVLVLAMGGFVILNTFRTVVAERRHDIGMLRALGASRRTILGMILAESLLQGVIGTAIGLLLGWLLSVGAIALLGSFYEQVVNLKVGQPVFGLPVFIFAIGMGVGITVLSGLIPARSASRVTPLEALRPSVGEVERRAIGRGVKIGLGLIVVATLSLVSGDAKFGMLGALLFMIALVLVAPALVKPIAALFSRILAMLFAREGQIAQGNLSRQPGRAAITASAVMIGTALIIAIAGMISSIEHAFIGYLDKSLGADYLLMPPSLLIGGNNIGAAPQLAQTIRELPGVANVTSLRLGNTSVDGTATQLVGIDPSTYPAVAGLQFTSGDETQAYGALGSKRAMIVNGIFASRANIQVGDVLAIQTAEGEQTYRVVGIALDYLNAKAATGYISQANLAADFHESNDRLIMVNKAADAGETSVQASIRDALKSFPTFTLIAFNEWRGSQAQIFQQMTFALYFLMIMLALPSLIALINTLAINVIERTREIGMIRAVGGTRRQVRRMILAESVLLAAMGTSFGILSGLWLGYALIGALTVNGLVTVYFFPLVTVLISVAIGLLFGVLASVLPARQAARLDIVTALHYE